MRSANLEYSERLDHLRLAACLLVILFHTVHPAYCFLTGQANVNSYKLPLDPFSIFVVDGHTGVALFLTLSGFLFARICRQGSFSIKNFYLNRFLRIYPLFVFILLIAIVFGKAPNPWNSLLGSLLTLQNTPNAVHIDSLSHLWTLAVELQFYLLFPLLLWMYRCKHGLDLLLLFLGLDIFALATIYMVDGHVLEIAYSTTLGRISQCMIGMMLGFNLERLEAKLRHPICLFASIAILSCLLMVFHSWGGTVFGTRHPMWIIFPSLEGVAWGAVIVSYLCSAKQLPARLSKLLAAGGALSYSLYVWHFYFTILLYPLAVTALKNLNHGVHWLLPVQKILLAHPFFSSVLVALLVVFPPTLLLSIVTYNFIEMPFFKLRRRYIFPDGAPAPAAKPFSATAWEAARFCRAKGLRTLRMTASVAAVMLVVTGLGELACRAANVGQSAYLQPDERLGFGPIPLQEVRWNWEGCSCDRISSAGLRDVEHSLLKPPGVKRVLILGDSLCEGLQVPLDKTVARRLQHKIDSRGHAKIEVINAACSAYSLGQMAVAYDRLANLYKPDQVFLLYAIGNSLLSVRDAHDYSVACRPYFYMKNNVLSEDATLLPSKSFCAFAGYLLKNSRLANYLAYEDFQHVLKDENYRLARASLLSSLRIICCKPIEYPPQEASEVRNALLSFLNRVVRLNGAELTVFSMPSRGVEIVNKDNKDLVELSARQNFAVVTLDDVYEKAGSKARLKYHFSELGHEILARQMYEKLSGEPASIAQDCQRSKAKIADSQPMELHL